VKHGLRGELMPEGSPLGYVSFLTALIHHGVIVEGLTAIHVASLDRAGSWDVEGTPLEFHMLPRDLWFGYEVAEFEGERIPVATPEKALLDWCWLAEEQGLDPRLEEMEWAALDVARVDRLAAETGVSYRALLPVSGTSRHDQTRFRLEAVRLLLGP